MLKQASFSFIATIVGHYLWSVDHFAIAAVMASCRREGGPAGGPGVRSVTERNRQESRITTGVGCVLVVAHREPSAETVWDRAGPPVTGLLASCRTKSHDVMQAASASWRRSDLKGGVPASERTNERVDLFNDKSLITLVDAVVCWVGVVPLTDVA